MATTSMPVPINKPAFFVEKNNPVFDFRDAAYTPAVANTIIVKNVALAIKSRR